jgi:hypothetical protein
MEIPLSLRGMSAALGNAARSIPREADTRPWQQPVAAEGAVQTDERITCRSEAAAFHHPACEPAGDDFDNAANEKSLMDVCMTSPFAEVAARLPPS